MTKIALYFAGKLSHDIAYPVSPGKEEKMKEAEKIKAIHEYLVGIARRGGKASAKKLTKAQRSERARLGGLAGGRGRGKAGAQ